MKTTKNIWLKGILALSILAVLCTPLIVADADAQSYSHHVSWYGGIASLAEKEIRTNEQKAKEGNEINEVSVATIFTDDTGDNVKEHLNDPEDPNVPDK
jgi:hypothetical protein